MSYVFLKSGAASPVIPFEFFDGNGNPFDLTGKTVTLKLRPWNSATYIINGDAATINTPTTGGTGYFALSTADTIAGHHLAEWTINPGSLIMPVDGYVHVVIAPSL